MIAGWTKDTAMLTIDSGGSATYRPVSDPPAPPPPPPPAPSTVRQADAAAGASVTPSGESPGLASLSSLSPVEQGRALRQLDLQTGSRLAGDAWDRLGEAVREALPFGSTGSPAASPEPETCTVEVRFTPIAKWANHAFIVTSDADSTRFYRGGPGANGNGLNSSSSGSSDSTGGAETYDARYGMYGPIVTEYGAYRPGTVDWTTEPSGQQTVDRFAGNCDAVDASFARTMDDIEAAGINYMPLGQNSNSTVREGLERAGYPDVDPVVWAPAWNTQLDTTR